MRLKKGYVLREVCGISTIMGEGLGAINFGKMLVLNETAAWIWGQAKEMTDFTIGSLTDKLCEEYDVSPDQAKADIAGIINEWQKVGLVE